jgi:hypothetical protein
MGLVTLLRDKPAAAEPRKKRDKAKADSGARPWLWFVMPIAGVAILYLASAPLDKMSSEHFYAGAESIGSSLLSLATSSLQHSGPLRSLTWMERWSQVVAYALAPLILATGLAFGILRRNRALMFTAGPRCFRRSHS